MMSVTRGKKEWKRKEESQEERECVCVLNKRQGVIFWMFTYPTSFQKEVCWGAGGGECVCEHMCVSTSRNLPRGVRAAAGGTLQEFGRRLVSQDAPLGLWRPASLQ